MVEQPPAPEPVAEPPPPPEPVVEQPPEPVAKPKAKRSARGAAKPRAQPGIGKIPPKQGVDPPPEPPPLERQEATFPLMSSEDFGVLFGNYLQAQQMNRRATKRELYRTWVGL